MNYTTAEIQGKRGPDQGQLIHDRASQHIIARFCKQRMCAKTLAVYEHRPEDNTRTNGAVAA